MILFFVIGVGRSQMLQRSANLQYLTSPSQYELALLIAKGHNLGEKNLTSSLSFQIKKSKFSQHSSTPNYSLNSVDLSFSKSQRSRTDNSFTIPFLSLINNPEKRNQFGYPKIDSYQLYYMPTYKEINVALPKSKQILNYFLTLSSSLYVSSKQSEK